LKGVKAIGAAKVHQWNAAVGVWNLRGTGEPWYAGWEVMGGWGSAWKRYVGRLGGWMTSDYCKVQLNILGFLDGFGSLDAEHRTNSG